MKSRTVISAGAVSALAVGGGIALFATGAATSLAATTFKSLPINTKVLIADRHAITAINRSNGIAGRIAGSTVVDIAAVSMAARSNTVSVGSEGNGVLAGAAGSLYAPLSLPEGATITGLTLRTRDNDPTLNVLARIQRRAVAGNYSPTAGLTTVAQASSSGAADQIRSFAVKVTANNKIANAQSTVYVELILPSENSALLQPLSVQVTYRAAPIKYKKVKLP